MPRTLSYRTETLFTMLNYIVSMARPIKLPEKGILIKRYGQFVPFVDLTSIENVVNSKTRPNGGGLYALHDNYGLYYVGLTTKSIRGRLRQHTKDRHRGKWNKFSWYHVPKIKYVKDVETLLLKVIRPPGNSVSGRLPRRTRIK